MRTAGVGPPRPPTPAAALPHGDFTRRRQEGVRPENQQVRGFPRPSQLFPASLTGRPGRGGRSGCGSGGGTAPPRQTAVAWSRLPAPDSWASPAAAAAARCRPALGRVPAARLLRRAATLGASRRSSAGPGAAAPGCASATEVAPTPRGQAKPAGCPCPLAGRKRPVSAQALVPHQRCPSKPRACWRGRWLAAGRRVGVPPPHQAAKRPGAKSTLLGNGGGLCRASVPQ